MDRTEFYNALEANEASLAHSSGGWKKHKYISKVFKAGKWIYKYPITGQGYLDDTKRYNKIGDNLVGAGDKYNTRLSDDLKSSRRYANSAKSKYAEASNYYSKAKTAASNYSKKSLSGIAASTFAKNSRAAKVGKNIAIVRKGLAASNLANARSKLNGQNKVLNMLSLKQFNSLWMPKGDPYHVDTSGLGRQDVVTRSSTSASKPVARKKNVTASTSSVRRRGNGLGSGKVGNR